MEWGGNLCLHIHLINQSQCSLYMCICIYFYLLKCFRLLGTEKAFVFLYNKTQSGVPPGLDSSMTQLCHQEHSFFPSFFCAFLGICRGDLHWLLQGCKVIIIGTGVSSRTSPDFQRQRTPDLLPVKGNLSRTLISDLESYQQRLCNPIKVRRITLTSLKDSDQPLTSSGGE